MMSSEQQSWGTLLKLQILTALCYFITGRLGLAFAADSAYATAIWIPSGIAVAAVVLWGYRLGVGVLIGSFLVNYSLTLENTGDILPLEQTLLFLLIGTGAATQSCLGRFLAIRFGRYPNTLSELNQIFLFIFLVGPVSCLVGATVGCTSLVSAGLVPVEKFAQNWAVWWLGDSIGAAIFGPLLLVWGVKPDKMWQARRLPVSFTLLTTFLLATIGFTYARNSEETNVRLRLETDATSLAVAFEQNLKAEAGVLETVALNISLPQRSSRNTFEEQTRWLLARYPNIQAVSWNPFVESKIRRYIEFIMQRDYGSQAVFRELVDGELVPAPEREYYIPVQFLLPLEGNESALGFNVASNIKRLKALEKARDNRQPVVTGKIRLVQDPVAQVGVLMFFPKFDFESNELIGFFTAVLKIGQLMESFFESQKFEGFLVRVMDSNQEDMDSQMLYQVKISRSGLYEKLTEQEEAILNSGSDSDQDLVWQTPIKVADRQWLFVIAPTDHNYASKLSISAWLVYLLGLMFSVMSGMVALFFTGRTVALESMIQERTAALKDSEMSLKAIVDNSPEAIFVVNEKGLINSANRSAQLIFERTPEQLQLEPIRELIPVLQDCDFTATLRGLGGRSDGVIEAEGVRSDGSCVPIDCNFADYGLGTELYHLIIVRDITERAEIDRIKDEFISTVSHELRTPLTAIKGALGLIGVQKNDMNDKVAGLLDIASRNSERLLELVNRILDFKKIAGEEISLRLQRIKAAPWLEDLIKLNQPYADQFRVKFVLDDIDRDLEMIGDSERLAQVVANLLSNAAKFSKVDSLVHICAYKMPEVIRVEVRDTGPGIPDGFKNNIFGRFAQADSSSTRSKGGSGLGLNISKAIVEKHGGKLNYKNHEHGGCSFYFDLPKKTDF